MVIGSFIIQERVRGNRGQEKSIVNIVQIRDILRSGIAVPLLQVSNQIKFRGLPLIIESDASGSGWGAVLDKHWLRGRWPLEMQKSNIEVLESLAVLFAVNV